MEILIKGIEKPKECWDCPLKNTWHTRAGLHGCCRLNPRLNFQPYQKPFDNCPLVELPPHGNLVDMDILKETIASIARKELAADESWIQMLYALDNAPTVLEANE